MIILNLLNDPIYQISFFITSPSISYPIISVRERKTTSSQGILRPVACWNPNSSSDLWSKLWNSGWSNHDIGIIYLLLFSPTYTAKWPFGTSSGSPCCWSYPIFFPRLEHLLSICLRAPVWRPGNLLGFVIAIDFGGGGKREERGKEKRKDMKVVMGKNELRGYLLWAEREKRVVMKDMWGKE